MLSVNSCMNKGSNTISFGDMEHWWKKQKKLYSGKNNREPVGI